MPCTNCMANYTMLRKEHGCSNCGYGFCAKCLTKKFLLPKLSPKPVSVCDGCYKSLTGEIVRPLEKSRAEASNDAQWWGPDEKPPPSLRHLYPTKSKSLQKNDKKKATDADEDAQIAERLAKVMNRPVDEIKNPRYMVTDKDSGEVPSTSTEILNNLNQPPDAAETFLNRKHDLKDDALNLPKPPPHVDSIEGLQERLAALRGVPVEMIRNPRLMVMNNEDSEPELDNDAKNLLESAEKKLRKREPDLFYENEGLDSDDDEQRPEVRPHRRD